MFRNLHFSSVPHGPEIRLVLLRLSLKPDRGSVATGAAHQIAIGRERLKEAVIKADIPNASGKARWELIKAFRDIQWTLRRFEGLAKSITQEDGNIKPLLSTCHQQELDYMLTRV